VGTASARSGVTTIELDTGASRRVVRLVDYVSAELEEGAHEDAYRWIKAVRHLRVGGIPFRRRFTFRGDSLWWFAELYLHKTQEILNAMRTIGAVDALIAREAPRRIRVVEGNATLLGPIAAARGIQVIDEARTGDASRTHLETRARALAAEARLSRVRTRAAPARRTTIAAFIHRAFWRERASGGPGESYIGPVLEAIEAQLPPEAVGYVGVGPRRNFRARRWWQALLPDRAGRLVPIERYSTLSKLEASAAIWHQRHEILQALCASDELRAHAVIRGCDCWNVVEEQLAGIALLQFPWSARAMDEAGAALDALSPSAAVTYAEAGGWGRALALECRRRHVPLAGVQHGFIYRHWLNYRHEPDEMEPDAGNPTDCGFPRPALTLLFDAYAERHLTSAGHFPPESLRVTGSARLEDLVAAVRSQTDADVAATRAAAGAADGRALILLATKEREAAPYLAAVAEAVRAMPDAQLAVKPHPAETADVYDPLRRAAPNIHVLPSSFPLAAALAASRVVVTVNSTVAIDALPLGIPSLVIGLPNNLSPFVDAGVMAGARTAEEIRAALARLLYDEEFRTQLARAAGPLVHQPRAADGPGAAARAANAILDLARV
jgi:hypothetical protein